MKNKNLPNFLIVGAAKSGTTSLYYYLKEHPEIYLHKKRKEIRFFSQMQGNFKGPGDEHINQTITKTLEEYKKYFEEVKNEKRIGDISPDYLYYYKKSIANIKKYLNSPKIIIILRNPIERAFSAYTHLIRDNREFLSFEEALNKEEERKKNNWEFIWYYKDVGLYFNQVRAYMENFEDVKVYLYDDLQKDRLKLLKDIYKFLDVDDSFVPESLNDKFNVSGVPKNRLFHRLLKKENLLKKTIRPIVRAVFPKEEQREKIINKLVQKNLKKPQLNPETREYLKNFYREDILKLQNLIKKDLTHWLK